MDDNYKFTVDIITLHYLFEVHANMILTVN